jgi:hypothetical protein
MSTYDLETRRLLSAERLEQLQRDAAVPPARQRSRRQRRMQVMRWAVAPLLAAVRRAPKRPATA